MNQIITTAAFDGKNITPFDEIADEIQALYDEAKNWADGSEIETQAQCDALDVLDKSLMDAGKKLDALRVAEKKPLDEQIDAIQARFNPFIQPKKGKVDMARSALSPLRTAFKDRERRRKEAIAQQARQEAEEAARKAQEAMRASAGNLEAREEAERVAHDAKLAEQDARRMAKVATTGVGLRTSYQTEIADLGEAIRHYWSTRRDRFAALVSDLADEDVRRGVRVIPGFTITEIKKAI